MSFSLLVTQREVLERYQHSQVRNEQMRKDAANLTAIFVPISLDRLELLKKQYLLSGQAKDCISEFNNSVELQTAIKSASRSRSLKLCSSSESNDDKSVCSSSSSSMEHEATVVKEHAVIPNASFEAQSHSSSVLLSMSQPTAPLFASSPIQPASQEQWHSVSPSLVMPRALPIVTTASAQPPPSLPPASHHHSPSPIPRQPILTFTTLPPTSHLTIPPISSSLLHSATFSHPPVVYPTQLPTPHHNDHHNNDKADSTQPDMLSDLSLNTNDMEDHLENLHIPRVPETSVPNTVVHPSTTTVPSAIMSSSTSSTSIKIAAEAQKEITFSTTGHDKATIFKAPKPTGTVKEMNSPLILDDPSNNRDATQDVTSHHIRNSLLDEIGSPSSVSSYTSVSDLSNSDKSHHSLSSDDGQKIPIEMRDEAIMSLVQGDKQETGMVQNEVPKKKSSREGVDEHRDVASDDDFWDSPSQRGRDDTGERDGGSSDDDRSESNNNEVIPSNTPTIQGTDKGRADPIDSASSSDSLIPMNHMLVLSSLTSAINGQLRQERGLVHQLYAHPSLPTDGMKQKIQNSKVLNLLLKRRAEAGKDLSTWDASVLGAVVLQVLGDLVASQGPPPTLTGQQLPSSGDSGWGAIWPVMVEHLRLLFQCGLSVNNITAAFSPVFNTPQDALLRLLQEECGIELSQHDEDGSSLHSSLSSLTRDTSVVDDREYRSFYESLLRSSATNRGNDSSGEDSVLAAIQQHRSATGSASSIGDEHADVNDDNIIDDGDNTPSDKFPSIITAPKPIVGSADDGALRRRLGMTEDDISDIESHMITIPSCSSENEDDFDFYS